MGLCVNMCICSAGIHGDQMHQISLELELWAAVNCLTWALGTELKSSGRAVCDLNLGAISARSV